MVANWPDCFSLQCSLIVMLISRLHCLLFLLCSLSSCQSTGSYKITLKDGPGAVEVLDSNGNSIKLEAAGITVTASAKVTVNASQVAISAGMVTVDAGMSKFSGVVQADTVITNSVISASYTPGAGNIW